VSSCATTPPMATPTISDVARAAGVSLGTVSNVLNQPEIVAVRTRERVLAAIEQLGFVRNNSARQLSRGRSLTVGLVVLDVTNPFYTEVARGVEDALSDDGYLMILCNSGGSAEREARHLRALEEQRVGGLLITPAAVADPPALRRLREKGTAVVLVDRRSRSKDQCSVSVDDAAGGRLAAEHLMALGHRRIGLVNAPTSIKQAADRRRGFLASLAEAGCPVAPAHDILSADAGGGELADVAGGELAASRILDDGCPPTAVFCGSDLLAIGALRAAAARGIAVPEDLAIVGYDDVLFAASSTVPLTSVRQPMYELGRRAARLMLDEIRDPAGHRHERHVFQPELVVRASTAGRGD